LISISRNLAPFDKLGWKVITLKRLVQSSAPVHLWAPKRSRIVDPASQDCFSGLELRAFGRRGLSIEEVDDNNMYRRAQSKAPFHDQLYAAELREILKLRLRALESGLCLHFKKCGEVGLCIGKFKPACSILWYFRHAPLLGRKSPQ
jgi:hypothetical protein